MFSIADYEDIVMSSIGQVLTNFEVLLVDKLAVVGGSALINNL